MSKNPKLLKKNEKKIRKSMFRESESKISKLSFVFCTIKVCSTQKVIRRSMYGIHFHTWQVNFIKLPSLESST